jgi:hypothetical protein
VSNTTSGDYQVSVFPVLLTQNLTGAFDFSSTPPDLAAAKLALSVSPTAFGLASGQQQQVGLHWNLLPQGRRWVAAGVVFQGVPQGQRTTLHVITRLLNVNFLRLPGRVHIAGIFTGLFPEQLKPRVLRFVARVKNVGDDFTAPSDGQLVIRDSAGDSVFNEPWKGVQLLPGATVDFPIDVTKVLQAGRYTATVTMNFGGARRRTVPFTLIGPNQLPTPAITIRGLNATGEIGSPTQVTARIISSGTAPASLSLHLFLGNAQNAGASALATGTVSYSHLAPGRVLNLSRPLGGALRKGSYRVIATWTDPTGAQHSLEADFSATPAHSWLDSLWDFIKGNIVLFIGLLVIALVIALAWVIRRLREHQRQVEAELAAARAQLRTGRGVPTPAEPVGADSGNGAGDRAGARPSVRRPMPKPSLSGGAVEQPPRERPIEPPPLQRAVARPPFDPPTVKRLPLEPAVARAPSAPAPTEAQKLAATAEVDRLLARLKAKSSSPRTGPPPSGPGSDETS